MPQFDSGAAEPIGRFSEGLLLRLLHRAAPAPFAQFDAEAKGGGGGHRSLLDKTPVFPNFARDHVPPAIAAPSAMVIEALRKRFNPSIGPNRSLIDRWSCSIRLLRYFEDLILVRLPR
jgi:hypothetical protein